MSKKQLTIRYNAETYRQFIAANPDLEDLSVGNLLDHLMRLYPHLTTEIELQNALINAISAQPQQAHQQTQETLNDRPANDDQPAAVDQQRPAALVTPTPAPEQQFFDILDIDDD